MGSSFPWDSFDDALKERAKGLFESEGGLTSYDESAPVWKGFATRRTIKSDYESFDEMWDKIRSGGLWYRPVHRFKNWETLFKTPTGKFEFFSARIAKAINAAAQEGSLKSALEDMGVGAKGDEAFLPHYEATASSVDKKTYPLRMMPYGLINLSSTWWPNPPYLNKTLFDHQLRKNESFAEINPKTAAEYNLNEGDQVIVKSRRGEVQVKMHLFEGAMPGVVYLPLGFGHTAYDGFQRDKGVNPTEIIDGGKDPLSGQTVWWDTHVSLIKI